MFRQAAWHGRCVIQVNGFPRVEGRRIKGGDSGQRLGFCYLVATLARIWIQAKNIKLASKGFRGLHGVFPITGR